MTIADCLAAQERWFRANHPEVAAGMEAIGMTFAEYHARAAKNAPPMIVTANSTAPLPPVHFDIRHGSYHEEGWCEP